MIDVVAGLCVIALGLVLWAVVLYDRDDDEDY